MNIKNKKSNVPNSSKGFTLIEMLVVVAIVGILSATVLSALGPARNKAKDTRIISSIKQSLIIAETLYDSNNTSHYAAAATAFTNKTFGFGNLYTDVTNQGGQLKISVVSNSVAFSSLLASTGTYCSDSNGKTGTAEAAIGVCP